MSEKQLKTIPRFETEDDERAFWATHDTTDYVDWSKAEVIRGPGAFPNLKRTESLISLHLDDVLTKKLKGIAKEESVDLAALAIQYLQEGASRHVHRATH